MSTVTEHQVLDALRTIIDPDFGKDIVSLGFVKNIAIEGERVGFDIELTTPACPVKAEFQKAAEERVGALPGVATVAVNMTSQPPRRAKQDGPDGLAGVRTLVAVSSCKGGVGKSTVAAGLAREFAHRGLRVGLLDTDLYGPSVPTLFNLHQDGVRATGENMMLPVETQGLKVMSFGFLLGNEPAVMRGPIVSNYLNQLLHRTQWGELDLLLLDLPPGTGDVQLTITQSLQLDGAIIVTTPHALSLTDVERGILMFDKVNVPVLGVVENMAYFVCGHCGEEEHVFGDATRGLTERYGLELLARLPLAPAAYGAGFASHANDKALADAADAVARAIGKATREGRAKPGVSFDSQEITITWPDDTTTVVNNFALRASCPCALCVNEMTGKKILKEADVRPDIAPETLRVVGNYALQVSWNDGHDSGLFSWEHLRNVAEATACAQNNTN